MSSGVDSDTTRVVGALPRRQGKWPEAQEHLATATTLYREMDMRSWLAEAELRTVEDGSP